MTWLKKSECIFPFLYNLIFKPYHVSSIVAPLWGGGDIDICPRRLFCPKFDAEKLSFEAFFGILHIFGSVEPEGECIFPFLYNLIFKQYHLSSPLAPLGGGAERWTYALADFFVRNLMPKNFEPFFGILRIFGNVQPKGESIFPFLYNLIDNHMLSPVAIKNGVYVHTRVVVALYLDMLSTDLFTLSTFSDYLFRHAVSIYTVLLNSLGCLNCMLGCVDRVWCFR